MTRFGTLLSTAALALAFGAGAALAQAPATSTAPATAKTVPAAKVAKEKGQFKLKTPTTAVGKECSAQADAKGLHGKERRAFRSSCKKQATAKKS